MANVRIIEEYDPTQFYPGRTRRISALVARSLSGDRQQSYPLGFLIDTR